MEMNIWEVGRTKLTTIKDFAEYIGVTRPTLYAWIKIGLPVIRNKGKGAKYLVLINEAENWINQNKVY